MPITRNNIFFASPRLPIREFENTFSRVASLFFAKIVSNIPKLVDNKRRHMEKSLSQAQRDHPLMSTTKEDLLMKKDILEAFERSNKTLDDSITKKTTCLTSLGEGIASGMRLLAMALANPPANPRPWNALCTTKLYSTFWQLWEHHYIPPPPYDTWCKLCKQRSIPRLPIPPLWKWSRKLTL